MENIAKKTSLGIAVSEAITELALDDDRAVIQRAFYDAFTHIMDELRKRIHEIPNLTINLRGDCIIDNEFPIGANDRKQYFRSLNTKMRIGNCILNTGEVPNKNKIFTLIEGYSKNDNRRVKMQDKKKDKLASKNRQENIHWLKNKRMKPYDQSSKSNISQPNQSTMSVKQRQIAQKQYNMQKKMQEYSKK